MTQLYRVKEEISQKLFAWKDFAPVMVGTRGFTCHFEGLPVSVTVEERTLREPFITVSFRVWLAHDVERSPEFDRWVLDTNTETALGNVAVYNYKENWVPFEELQDGEPANRVAFLYTMFADTLTGMSTLRLMRQHCQQARELANQIDQHFTADVYNHTFTRG